MLNNQDQTQNPNKKLLVKRPSQTASADPDQIADQGLLFAILASIF